MFRHIVLLTFDDATTDDDLAQIVSRLEALPRSIPEIRRYVVGRDAGISEGNADLSVIADFDDVDGYVAYRDNPEHRAFIAEWITPRVTNRTAVQTESTS